MKKLVKILSPLLIETSDYHFEKARLNAQKKAINTKLKTLKEPNFKEYLEAVAKELKPSIKAVHYEIVNHKGQNSTIYFYGPSMIKKLGYIEFVLVDDQYCVVHPENKKPDSLTFFSEGTALPVKDMELKDLVNEIFFF